MLASCQPKREDVLHGCVEELSVLGVVLRMKHKCC
jgi:hypothetical protein